MLLACKIKFCGKLFFEGSQRRAVNAVRVGFHEVVDFDLNLVLDRISLLSIPWRYLVAQVFVEKVLDEQFTNVFTF